MENAVGVTSIQFNIIGGLGLFFSGVGVLRFVTAFKKGEGKQCHSETFRNSLNLVVIANHDGPGGDYWSILPLQALAD